MGKRFNRLRDKLSPQSDKYENILGLDFYFGKIVKYKYAVVMYFTNRLVNRV